MTTTSLLSHQLHYNIHHSSFLFLFPQCLNPLSGNDDITFAKVGNYLEKYLQNTLEQYTKLDGYDFNKASL